MPVHDKLVEIDQSCEKPLSEAIVSDRLKQEFNGKVSDLEISDQADVIAFMLFEGNNNKQLEPGWAGYFGAMAWQLSDGSVHVSPAKELISQEILTVWTTRVTEFAHPLLRTRYLGLVFDLQREICENPPTFQIAKDYIASLITTVEDGFCIHPSNGFEKLRRALEIAIRYRNSALIDRAKQAIIDYEAKVGDDNKPGLWGWTIDHLLKEKGVKLSATEEGNIINGMTVRYVRLIALAEQDYMRAHSSLIAALKYLRDIYHQRNDRQNLQHVITQWMQVVLNQYQGADAMRGAIWLEELEKVLRSDGFTHDADRVMRIIHEHGPKVTESMGVIESQVSISVDEMNAFVEAMLAGDPCEVYLRFANELIPNKTQSEANMLKQEQEHSFLSMLRTDIHNHDRKVTSVRPSSTDTTDALAHYLHETIRFGALWRDRVLRNGEKRGIFTVENSLAFLGLSAGVSTERLPLIEIALRHYFQKEFVQFVHLVLPQIEQALRELLHAAGGNVLKHSKDGRGHHLRILDDLLRDEQMQIVISPDLAFYFQVILSHQCGFNLRNDCLHGLLPPKSFGQQMADLVFHALICLGLIRPVSKGSTDVPSDQEVDVSNDLKRGL